MKALICGVGGQDGAYLAKLLLEKGYDVVGTSRDATLSRFDALRSLGILDRIETISMALNDFRSVLHTVKRHAPDEIYNLAGQSSVGLSFEQPVETMESIAGGTLNLLEALRFVDRPLRFYNAGSSECFGDTGNAPATESTPFQPRSPYAVAKSTAHWLVRNYREAYGLFACTGVLFNHESPLRPDRFVTQKIVRTAARIAAGECDRLKLGNISVERDWGWAPDYVDAMWRMLNASGADDYVIATGRTVSLEYFVRKVFDQFGLDWNRHLEVDEQLFRPTDIPTGRANPRKARTELGWSPTLDVDDVIAALCSAAYEAANGGR
ncbi:GDP-mannose 4,6-dehydratase [Aromatoleum petrolei]|uniref:GDP-mannose 4,6-dehydratase n=1 Tax=Aromatoleum petrolei TaxID=76116 RepID=A0ABX1MRN5_9RHOO|nr:GDP-mannose 4,6-dehydratase [Aromatoleum petrolei]NMF90634.1 NAD-dependent epimerase/dehydratase family protein [Aromatoleum petrolei]QTQ35904.1 GDP-mannose 4,6-dehydratase [Aromatoleum petrolei]